jgi:hypothetical protein
MGNNVIDDRRGRRAVLTLTLDAERMFLEEKLSSFAPPGVVAAGGGVAAIGGELLLS